MRYPLIILFFCCCSASFSQQPDSSLHLGVQLSGVFSRNNENGITPSVTLDYRRFSFAAGPRVSLNDRPLIIDASLRYFPFDSCKRIRPFVQLVAEYEYDKNVSKRYYNTDELQAYGPIFDHSFDGEWKSVHAAFNLHLGLGAEIPLWKELYVVVGGGAGPGFYQWESTVTNRSTGETEYHDGKNWYYRGISWIASAGCGYRF